SSMVMNPSPEDFPAMIRHRLEPELASLDLLKAWCTFVGTQNLEEYPVHLEVDTGMRRLGFDLNEGNKVGSLLRSHPSIRVRSVYTHLAASADSEQDAYT